MSHGALEALREVLFSAMRCADPAVALAAACEDLGISASIAAISELSEEDAAMVAGWISEVYPDRTSGIIEEAIRWMRQP